MQKGNDQHTSCSAFLGQPRLYPCLRSTCNCYSYLTGLVKVASPSSNEHESYHGRPRISDLSKKRRKRNHFTTALQRNLRLKIASEVKESPPIAKKNLQRDFLFIFFHRAF